MSTVPTHPINPSITIKEAMSKATSLYQSILINEHIQETIKNKAETLEMFELMQNISSEELYEIVNSVSSYDSTKDIIERIKETFKVNNTDSPELTKLKEEHAELERCIEALYKQLHNLS